MKRLRKGIALCLGVGVGAFVLAGCALTGGGWMYSAISNSSKATFGFDLVCDGSNHVVGPWTYHDKAASIDVAGEVTADDNIPCDSGVGLPPATSTWHVSYTAQHCSSDCSGTADITVTDSGINGKPPRGDQLTISLTGGVDDGYENDGTVQGGNLIIGS
jgi:hypothetical protein